MEKIDIAAAGIREIVIEEIRDLARQYGVDRVILFGSRSRGDYKRTSDIDLAVSGGNFARFALDVDEDTSTLLMFDIVNLDRCVQKDLLESIQRDGKILYEAQQAGDGAAGAAKEPAASSDAGGKRCIAGR